MKKDHRTYYIKIFKKGREVSNSHTKSLRRFLSNVRLVQFKDSMFKSVSIKVTYSLKENYLGKLEMFDNSGIYDNKKDLLFAAKAFAGEK